jgi:ABC-type hemin transport system substrate-binding protein
VARFDEGLSRSRANRPERSLEVVSWNEGMVAGAETTFDDQTRAAGLVNLAAREGVRGHRPVPVEQLTTWDPDLLVVSCGADCAASRQRALETPGISATKAGRDGAILAIESHLLFSTGLGMIDVVEILRTRGRGG